MATNPTKEVAKIDLTNPQLTVLGLVINWATQTRRTHEFTRQTLMNHIPYHPSINQVNIDAVIDLFLRLHRIVRVPVAELPGRHSQRRAVLEQFKINYRNVNIRKEYKRLAHIRGDAEVAWTDDEMEDMDDDDPEAAEQKSVEAEAPINFPAPTEEEEKKDDPDYILKEAGDGEEVFEEEEVCIFTSCYRMILTLHCITVGG